MQTPAPASRLTSVDLLRGLVMVDADPERLGIELVNRYRALKRQGII